MDRVRGGGAEKGTPRFSRLTEAAGGISRKTLTQTLPAMERGGLVALWVHPVVPPEVEYRLTELGFSLGAAFRGVWVWAAETLSRLEQARSGFNERD